MLRSLVIREGAAPAWVEGDAAMQPPQVGERLWVDVVNPSKHELELLRDRFDLHPVAIDSCLRIDTRPKIEEYRAQLFIVLHKLIVPEDTNAALSSLELHAFLGDGYLVTIQDDPLPEVTGVAQRLLAEPSLRERSLVYAYYLVCERLAHVNFDALDALFEGVEKIEDSVLQGVDDDVLPELFVAKRRLAGARRLIVPQREVLSVILDSGTTYIDERSRLYFRRVLDMLLRMSEAIDTQREILTNVLDAHLSLVSNRTNEIMKSLTLLSAIFLPLGFVTGFFGQNFEHLPFGSVGLMWLGLAICVLVPVAMLAWFKSRKWL